MKRFFATAVILFAAAVQAADGPAAPAQDPPTVYGGRTVVEVIEELRAAGNEIAYSSRLVPPDLVVTVEPESRGALNALLEILAPHQLTLQPTDEGIFLVVRMKANSTATEVAVPAAQKSGNEIERITVSASRYEISRDVTTSQFVIDQRTIQNMPDVGDDPIRITQRLPGAAASGASARAHFRGGEQSEVGIILNGQRLFDPFHIRDYQNIFSAIDGRAIEGVEVFTGGFPVRFGDRMSGLVVMESIDSGTPRHTEIGLSVFNTSFLHAVSDNDKQWLFSARRGNLDLVIDKKFGRPAYYDVFSQVAFDLGDRTTVSANLLYADDIVTLVLESDPGELEEARSTTRNSQAWLQFNNEWSSRLSSRTALSFTDYRNRRDGVTQDPSKVVASVHDEREVRQFGFRQDWQYRATDEHSMQWGFSIINSRADYAYDGQADYFGLTALYRGQESSVTRNVSATPKGASYALYVADRWKLSPKFIVEWGLRWDDQTYTNLSSDSQLSPRASLLYRWRPDTDLRFSWGRYHQSQGIQELQIEDGVSNFWPAQRADHLIAGLQHRLNDAVVVRVEAFHKDMQNVRPRFENLFDPLALIPEFQPDRVRLEPGSAKSSGLEVSVDGEIGDWSWWSSYTLSKATDSLNGRDELRSWDQRHAVQAGVSWANEKWQFALAAGSHTGWPTTDLDLVQAGVDANNQPVFEAVPGPRNVLQHPTFTSVDFRVSRKFDVRRGSLTAFIEVSNLMNRDNVCCTDWDVEQDDEGNTELESSRDFWLPLLPAIGVLWEF
ncbi:MAG: TonB-dependent receptor [Woeseiaceae bacterium]|nr:TonB-dependent receptor [Woeseiaceae bacterium]